MAHRLLTSAFRGTTRVAACRLVPGWRLFPRQLLHLDVTKVGRSRPAAATLCSGVITTFFASRRLSHVASSARPDIRTQLEQNIDERFKDYQISPVFLSPALPPTPAKDLSEASEFMQQLTQSNTAIIAKETVQHPLISVTHEQLIQPILESAKHRRGRFKPVVFATRGSGTGKTRALVESQLALMQHKSKSVLPIAITFDDHTGIDEESEGLNLHQDFDLAYAVMVCSRVLSAVYGEEGLEVTRTQLLEAINGVVEIRDFYVSAKRLLQATLTHVVRRMRQARPDRPLDTVVLMVDETHKAHEAIDKARGISNRPVALDYSTYLREAFLREELLPSDEHVDVAVCITSLVPVDETTICGRDVLTLPLADRVDAENVVDKWWLPTLLGKKEAKEWASNPKNALDRQRLVVLAESMASVPRLLECALTGLMANAKNNGGILQTDTDTYRQVMEVVSGSIESWYENVELSLDVLRAAIFRKEVEPVFSNKAVNTEGDEWNLSLKHLAAAIANSIIVNNEALKQELSFTPEVCLLMASHCMRMGKVTGVSKDDVELLQLYRQLGNDFLSILVVDSTDSLQTCAAWMLRLRLALLLLPRGVFRHVSLKQIFGLDRYMPFTNAELEANYELKQAVGIFDDDTKQTAALSDVSPVIPSKPSNLPELQVALGSLAVESTPSSSGRIKRQPFLAVLNKTILKPGKAVFWPKLHVDEQFDQLLAITAQDMTKNANGSEHRPYLVLIDAKSRYPRANPENQEPESDQAEFIRDIIRAAQQHSDVAPGSLLEALKEGRCSFIYHQVARFKKPEGDGKEGVSAQGLERRHAEVQAQRQEPPFDVYHLDEGASERFLGPMWPLYKAVRLACRLQHEEDSANAAE